MLKLADTQLGKMTVDIIVNKKTYSYEIGKDVENQHEAIVKTMQAIGARSGAHVRLTERLTTDIIVEIE